jgi:uncharacterized membrane protein YkvA (DUF1232 family)
MTQINTLKQKTQELHIVVYSLYLSFKDSSVKWYVRVLLALSIGYAISPIDLIPDFTPVFGYLDDIVIVALGLSAAYQLLSKDVLDRCRIRAYEDFNSETASSALLIVLYGWMLAASLLAVFFYKMLYIDIL